jgi:hypothetical protein
LLDVKPDGAFEFSIANELADYLIFGDKIDEICEKLMIEIDEPFMEKFSKNVPGYFNWIDEQFAVKDPPLALIEVGDTYSDLLQLVIVNKEDLPEIEALCAALKVKYKKTAC